MPIYDFLNKETGEIITEMFTYVRKVEYLKENPHLQSVLGNATPVSDMILYNSQKSNVDFKSAIRQIAKDYPTGNIRNTF